MVECFRRAVAVLAGEAIAGEDRRSGDGRTAPVRNTDEAGQLHDGRERKLDVLGAEHAAVGLEHRCLPAQDQDRGPPGGDHGHGFVRRIEDECASHDFDVERSREPAAGAGLPVHEDGRHPARVGSREPAPGWVGSGMPALRVGCSGELVVDKWGIVGDTGPAGGTDDRTWQRNDVFIGEYHHSLDDKGRVVLPAKFRSALATDRKATGFVSKGQERCLYIQPEDDWRAMAAKVRALPLTDRRGRAFSRGFFGSSESVSVDGQGRIMLPAGLREWAGLTDKAVLVGLMDRIEVWNPDTWAEISQASDDFYTTIEEKITTEDL